MERKREQESYEAQNLKNSSAAALSLHNILALKFFFNQSAHKKLPPRKCLDTVRTFVFLLAFISLSSFIKDSSEMMISVFSL